MHWAACSAAAPAIPRSSMRLWAWPARRARSPRRRQARRSARASRASMGIPRSRARRPTAPTPSRRTRSWFGPSARPITAPASASATLTPSCAASPGIVRVLTAADIPGRNIFGVIPPFADQPVFADRRDALPRRGRGGHRRRTRAVIADFDEGSFPIAWTESAGRPHRRSTRQILRPLCSTRTAPGNILVRGRVVRGDADAAIAAAAAVVEGEFSRPASSSTPISSPRPAAPGAWATASRSPSRRSRPIWTATRSPPFSDIDAGVPCASFPPPAAAASARKLDLSVQPFVALAAWLTGRPVRHGLYAAGIHRRPPPSAIPPACARAWLRTLTAGFWRWSSTATSIPAPMRPGDRRSPTACRSTPRVPISCPTTAPKAARFCTNCAPAGAFRGFGVPQTAIAQEQMLDMLAHKLGLDPLDFRIANALTERHRPSPARSWATASASVPASRRWRRIGSGRAATRWPSTRASGRKRRGVGIAGMWYGCGNTSLPNPSTIRIGLKPRRPHRAAPGRGRHRPGLQHRHRADRRRCARPAARLLRSGRARHRSHARLRQDLRLAPDLRHRQGG